MSQNKRDRELKEELEAHLRMAVQDRVDRGESAAAAQAAAHREFGNPGLIEEVVREAWGWAGLYRFLRDLRFGVRVLRRNPIFSLVAIFTLALGIAASTSIFSVVYGVLLRPLPYDKPEQIVRLSTIDEKGNRFSFSHVNFSDVHDQNRSLQAVAEYQYGVTAVSGGTDPRRVSAAYVSHDFFSVFHINPLIGRLFVPDEEKLHGPLAVIVSYSFWQQYMGRQKDLLSFKLSVENQPAQVIGVLPAGFQYPADTQLWLSSQTSEKPTSRTAGGWQVVGRLRDGVPLQQSASELSTLSQRIHQQFSEDNYMTGIATVPLHESITGKTRPALLVLMEVSGLLLLVACANVMNLLLAHASARSGELAVRRALGASRARIARQFVAESLLLCSAAAIAGSALAYWGVHALLFLAPRNIPRIDEVSVNLVVLGFALAISIVVATGLGIFTTIRSTRGDIQNTLAQRQKGQLGGARASHRLGEVIIAAQIAITVVLLVGAGLLGRSFLRVLSTDPGFRTEQIVTLDLALGSARDDFERAGLLQQALERMRVIPGVSEVGGTSDLPLGTGHDADGRLAIVKQRQLTQQAKDVINRFSVSKTSLTAGDYKALEEFFTPLFADKQHSADARYYVASPGYFRALGIPLKRGRLFADSDTRDALPVALINESLARQAWPDRDPVGETIEYGNMDGDLRLLTIVGVVGDVRQSSLETPPGPAVYVNYVQRPQKTHEFTLLLRTSSDATSTLNAAKHVIAELAPDVPVKLNSFTQVFSSSLDSRRFNLMLVGIFAGTALLLAIAGIYGVLAYSVTRRTRELGVRIALGASSSNVLALVIRQVALTASIGVAIGLVLAFGSTRLMSSMLFGIGAADPLTYVTVAALLLTAALVSAYLPARRATKVDPMVALRTQ